MLLILAIICLISLGISNRALKRKIEAQENLLRWYRNELGYEPKEEEIEVFAELRKKEEQSFIVIGALDGATIPNLQILRSDGVKIDSGNFRLKKDCISYSSEAEGFEIPFTDITSVESTIEHLTLTCRSGDQEPFPKKPLEMNGIDEIYLKRITNSSK